MEGLVDDWLDGIKLKGKEIEKTRRRMKLDKRRGKTSENIQKS